MLRTIFRIDGCVMLAVGLLLWGWPDRLLPALGIPPERLGRMALHVTRGSAAELVRLFAGANEITVLQENERTVFLGMLLIALGVASLALVYSMRSDLQRKAALYFIFGHLFLSFVVWTLMPGWSTFAGFIVFDLMIWPVPVLLYGLLPSQPAEAWRYRPAPPTKREIHEAAGQEERNRLAQDLHDSVKQQIFSVQTNLATAEARWDNDSAGARAAVEHARKAARDAMAEMSALLDRLRRDPIEGVGLVEALRRQCEALGFQTGATVSTSFGDFPEASLPSVAMTPVFRIAQESLANIARHSRASHVSLRLDRDAERNALLLEIRDDGCGFDTQSTSSGMGLRSMRLRAEEIGAEWELLSKNDEGTVIRLWLPLFDVRKHRMEYHGLRLLAVLIPGIAAGSLIVFREGSAPFLLPFLAVGGVLAAFHLFNLGKLRSA